MDSNNFTKPEKGLVITTNTGSKYVIASSDCLGGGAQGNVYLAETENGEKKAIKIYHDNASTNVGSTTNRMSATFNNSGPTASSDPLSTTITELTTERNEDFFNNLKQLCSIQTPDDAFVWPIDYFENGSLRGYVMDYIDRKHYHNLVDYDSSTCPVYVLTEIAIAIAEAFDKLHSKKMFFCDINRDDIFVREMNGRVELKICDCDNIPVTNYKPVIKGKHGFMAPEIITKEKTHSIKTDLFSISVIFFRLFIRLWPLEGKLTEGHLTAEKNFRLFGKEPVFIFDRKDLRNRPGENIRDLKTKINYWDTLPKYLKDLFYSSFEKGLLDDYERIPMSEWLDNLTTFASGDDCTGTREPCDKKRMNLLIMVDTSGSMEGDRIAKVNECLNLICNDIQETIPSDIEAFLDIMTFDNKAKWLFEKPVELNDVSTVELTACPCGDTMMDDAIERLYYSIGPFYTGKKESFLGHNLVTPIIILISDGEPTIKIDKSMELLKKCEPFKSALRYAFYIDEDCNPDTLMDFTGDERTVYGTYDLNVFRDLLREIAIVSSQRTSTLQIMPVNTSHRKGWAHTIPGAWTNIHESVASRNNRNSNNGSDYSGGSCGNSIYYSGRL